jgi:predicted AAA+ superfamily ATPase
MRSVSESLAGRAVYYTLLPMMLGEIEMRPPSGLIRNLFKGELPEEGKISVSHRSPFPWMLRGCMPTLMEMKSWSAVLKWWEGYVMTYLERDLRQLSQIESLPDFRRVMRALALRSGQLLNQTGISREIGVSQPTIHRY